MDKKTKGAWIIHHREKINNFRDTETEYESIVYAGKCSVLLSAITQTNQSTISNSRLNTLARAAGIHSKIDLPIILNELEKQHLINKSESGIETLGLTTTSILEHTTEIYENCQPHKNENAIIEISEKISEIPMVRERALEYISDNFKIARKDTKDLLDHSKHIGFFDSEKVDQENELFFNGNLFRNKDYHKIMKVINSLTQEEQRKIQELNALLDQNSCVDVDFGTKILGDILFTKLNSIGMYDINSITNEHGEFFFLTRPSSFCKFNNNLADDAFDLAKAFVTSLTYGMHQRASNRGRITRIGALMEKLIRGEWVGPATAIGQDYKILELKGVIQVRHDSDTQYSMKLLKKDVGELALSVISEGGAEIQILKTLPDASIADYTAPEENRIDIRRKNQGGKTKKGIYDLLDSLRTGG